jgi:hypothetical protein
VGTFVCAADVSGKSLANPTVISLLANAVLPHQQFKAWFFHEAYQLLDDEKLVALQQANRHGCTHCGEDADAGSVGDGLFLALFLVFGLPPDMQTVRDIAECNKRMQAIIQQT